MWLVLAGLPVPLLMGRFALWGGVDAVHTRRACGT